MIKNLATKPNINGSFNLVTCENPKFDASFPDKTDNIRDFILKFVFNSSTTNQFQVTFNLLSYLINPIIPVLIHWNNSLFVIYAPLCIKLGIDFFLSYKKSAQPFFSVVIYILHSGIKKFILIWS